MASAMPISRLRWAPCEQSSALLHNSQQQYSIGACAARIAKCSHKLCGLRVLMAEFGVPLTHGMSCVLGCFVSNGCYRDMNADGEIYGVVDVEIQSEHGGISAWPHH